MKLITLSAMTSIRIDSLDDNRASDGTSVIRQRVLYPTLGALLRLPRGLTTVRAYQGWIRDERRLERTTRRRKEILLICESRQNEC